MAKAKKHTATPEQVAALKELLEVGSHGGLDRPLADAITLPFGFSKQMTKHKVNTDPKGLWIEGMKKGAVVERTGGWLVAGAIAHHIGAEFEGALGRGTEFWHAIDAIKKHYGLTDANLK